MHAAAGRAVLRDVTMFGKLQGLDATLHPKPGERTTKQKSVHSGMKGRVRRRRFVGVELKESYYKVAVANLKKAASEMSLFEEVSDGA